WCARPRIRSSSGLPTTVSFATTSTFFFAALAGQVDDDVLDRPRLDGLADLVDEVAAEPAGARLRVRRHDDLVRRRLELGEGVADGVDGVGVDDEPVRRDPGVTQHLQRPLEPAARGGAARVLVDDVALARVVDRA